MSARRSHHHLVGELWLASSCINRLPTCAYTHITATLLQDVPSDFQCRPCLLLSLKRHLPRSIPRIWSWYTTGVAIGGLRCSWRFPSMSHSSPYSVTLTHFALSSNDVYPLRASPEDIDVTSCAFISWGDAAGSRMGSRFCVRHSDTPLCAPFSLRRLLSSLAPSTPFGPSIATGEGVPLYPSTDHLPFLPCAPTSSLHGQDPMPFS